MSSPTKPWERTGVNSQNSSSGLPPLIDQMSSGPTNLDGPSIASSIPPTVSRPPPPVPPRTQIQPTGYNYNYGGYSNYGGYPPPLYGQGYGGYGVGLNRNDYSPNGGYGVGLNRNDYSPNGFAQQAELSSRQAFQSIETIVRAVSSVAMMLDSTFQAVYNSFRAVIGVTDQFSRMKEHFAQIFSSLAIIRTIRWVFRKLLVLLRLRQSGGANEELWTEAAESAVSTLAEADISGETAKSTWPVMLFFGIVFGGPWLIWKILSSFGGVKGGGSDWTAGEGDHYIAVAEFDFRSESNEELSFSRGMRIIIAPKERQPQIRGWLMGTMDGKKIGLVPQNYIKMVGRRSGKQDAQSQPNPAQKNAPPKSQQMPRNQSMVTTAEPTNSAIPNEFNDFEFPIESPESDTVKTNNNHISSSSANVNETLSTES